MPTIHRLPAIAGTKAWHALFIAVFVLASGCYDGDALVKQAQTSALSATLAEIDLGEYSTTLPRDENTGRFMNVELHVFATVPRAHLADVKKQLKSDEFRVRHETLAAVRQSSNEDLTDPKFTKLRERIEKVVNKVLPDAPVREVGFYQLTVR